MLVRYESDVWLKSTVVSHDSRSPSGIGLSWYHKHILWYCTSWSTTKVMRCCVMFLIKSTNKTKISYSTFHLLTSLWPICRHIFKTLKTISTTSVCCDHTIHTIHVVFSQHSVHLHVSKMHLYVLFTQADPIPKLWIFLSFQSQSEIFSLHNYKHPNAKDHID